MLLVAIRAALYGSAFVALWTWLAILVFPLEGPGGISLPVWLAPAGWAIGLLGAGLTLSCVIVFVAHGLGTPAPFDPPRRIVAVGPYRCVRNPMYLGGFGMLAGAALALHSFSLLCLSLLFLAATHVFVVLYEEPVLGRQFGSSYEHYKRSVPRWIPRSRPQDPRPSP